MSAMLTTSELQELIKVDRSTIYRMAESGTVPAVKVGRQWRFPAAEIDSWLGRLRSAQNGVPAPSATPSAEAGLAALLPAAAVEGLLDMFADTLGVMVVLTDMRGTPLTPVANPCGFYSAIAEQPAAFERCVAGWADMAAQPGLQPRLRPSQLGFLCAHSYVRVDHRLTGMVMAGGLAPAEWPPSRGAIEALAGDLHVPAALLHQHVGEVFSADETHRARIVDATGRLGDVLSRFANERNALVARLGEIATLAANPEQRSSK